MGRFSLKRTVAVTFHWADIFQDMHDIEIETTQALWDWLAQNHAQTQSIRLITWKAAHPEKYVWREDVLDVLMAHGWTDERWFVVDEDRMHPAGEAAVKTGKASGL